YFKRLGQSFGVPTSKEELQQMGESEQNLPTWQRMIPHMPGSSPSKGMSVAEAAGGPLVPLLLNYLKTAGGGVKDMLHESVEAGKNIGEGGPVGPNIGKAGSSVLHAALQATPFVGPTVETAGEDISKGHYRSAAGGLTGAISQIAMPEKTGYAADTASIFTRPGLKESTHRMLSDSATKTKQLVGQGGTVHQAVSKHFEQLANDVTAADYAQTPQDGKKIDMSPVWEAVSKYGDDYAAGKTTPNFNAITDAIQKRPVEMTWKELHDLSKEVGSRWDKSAPGTRDAAAAADALSDIRQKLDARAQEVGRGKQWDAAKTIWSTLKEYQGDGALAKLMNTIVDPVTPGGVSEGGKQFFDILRDPAALPKLKEANRALEAYGMPKDYFTDLAKSHAPLHNMVVNSGSNISIGGRMRAISRAVKENPAVSVPAVGA